MFRCLDEGVKQRFSAVARGQSHALIERPHREFWVAMACEFAERNMELDEWEDVFHVVLDKLSRRPTSKGGNSPFELKNGTPPLFHGIQYLKSLLPQEEPSKSKRLERRIEPGELVLNRKNRIP
jgi:hypothetical protein